MIVNAPVPFCILPSEFCIPPMSISAAARRVARLLKGSGRKIVFAESCTAGLVSSSLTRTPGISDFHCGGMVVYRNETKQAYLRIPATTLDDPGPVSREVAELMATRVLKHTPEADLAASVTGHLGPNAPAKLDGVIFAAVAWRKGGRLIVKRFRCREEDPRSVRQRWVVERVLELVAQELREEDIGK